MARSVTRRGMVWVRVREGGGQVGGLRAVFFKNGPNVGPMSNVN